MISLINPKKQCFRIAFSVEKIGLEPTTSWLPAKRSSQLSYIPKLFLGYFSTSGKFKTFLFVF
jgi:hypothetical protein